MALKATLDGAPEGVRIEVHLSAEPNTPEEFEAIIEAAGGPAAFRVGFESRWLVADLDGAQLVLYPPKVYKVAKPPTGHPFIREFAEKIEAAKGGES